MRVAAIYSLYSDTAWLRESLEGVYDVVDAVYCFVSERPFHGDAGDNQATYDLLRAFPDPERKLYIASDSTTVEIEKRTAMLRRVEQDGYDYALVVDGDELYDPEALRRMLAYAERYPGVQAWRCAMWTYWKDSLHRIDPPEPLRPIVLVKLNEGLVYHYVRDVNATVQNLIPPAICMLHHLSYAGDDARIRQKITSWSHADELVDGWWKRVWKGWDANSSMEDVHPTHPAFYKRVITQSFGLLPLVLRRRYLQEHGEPPALESARPLRLSLSMIVRDCEGTIGPCLDSVCFLVDEMVVVDTGSTDRTVEIAEAYGANVYHFPWRDDFSAALNYALAQCHGEWCLRLDGDEELAGSSIDDVRKAITVRGGAFYVRIHSVVTRGTGKQPLLDGTGLTEREAFAHPEKVEWQDVPLRYRITSTMARLHPREGVHWEGSIHEQLLRVDGAPLPCAYSPIDVIHHGYEDPAREVQKQYRNLALLERQVANGDQRSQTLYFLGMSQQVIGEHIQARDQEAFRERIQWLQSSAWMLMAATARLQQERALYGWVMPWHVSAYAALSSSLCQAGNYYWALQAMEQGLRLDSNFAPLWYAKAEALYQLGRAEQRVDERRTEKIEQARRAALRALQCTETKRFAVADPMVVQKAEELLRRCDAVLGEQKRALRIVAGYGAGESGRARKRRSGR